MFITILQAAIVSSVANVSVNTSALVSPSASIVEVVQVDTRAARIDRYFELRSMPLAGYGKKMVEEADKCGMDWRLIPAIGVRESSGGKRLMNNNPYGWGSAKIYFEDFGEATEVLAWNLCGNNPNTARYYADNTAYEKLYWYNGTVLPSYPDEVVFIMNMIENTELEK